MKKKIEKSEKTIIYVNFSPYENTGKILDFLKENFSSILLFSLNFHQLEKNSDTNKLLIFKNKKIVKKYRIFQFSVPPSLVFLLLPLRSILILLQIVIYSLLLKKRFKKYDYYFTVNAFTAWIGQLLKKFNIVNSTIFWVWDYYPPINANPIILFMRKIYWQFDKISTFSNHVVFLNQRLINLRKKANIINRHLQFPIVPIGTDPKQAKIHKPPFKEIRIGFLGVLKKNQGLDLLFDNSKLFTNNYKDIILEIIGTGPDLSYFKEKAKSCSFKVNFYGLHSIEGAFTKKILSRCLIGIAPFVPGKDNVSYYGDPSKIKVYLSFGMPVVTTNVFLFAKEIKKSNAGIIIKYSNPQEFIKAIDKILNNYSTYQKNAINLAIKYNYETLYKKVFDFITKD